MAVAARCPRCSAVLRPPSLMSSTWSCEEHGPVEPYFSARPEAVSQVSGQARVPLWAPQPLLHGWTMGGLGWCGDERTGATATLLALAGPSPLGGPADLVLVAEEPGVGLGAHLAGSNGVDPESLTQSAPDAKILANGHPTPLWRTASADDRAAFVGEASGVWLWAVLWPPAAELVLMEHVDLRDLRHHPQELPLGAASPRLP
ncbi:MAG TPA: DUF6758 family protein [Mycobacteriales bacterium]|nr:DUF6758 family protein [Mycobacteriales bacterium]